MAWLSLVELQQQLAQKEVSVRDVVELYLDRNRERDREIGAFLRIREQSRTEAEAADRRLAAGELMRPLEGVVVAVKDNMGLRGEEVTAASKILRGYKAVTTSTAVERLQRQGAIVIGKTNLDEFAMGASTENSGFQPTHNPWNLALVPGGSSGGSAAAVASGQALVALGSDTGGSIRQPAALTNLVGFKPTYGRVSRFGIVALASSLDQIGPMAHSVVDAARMYAVMAGHDDHDATTSHKPIEPWSVDDIDIKRMRIGLPREFFGDGVDPDVQAVVLQAAETLKALGATVVDVSLPHAREALATYYIIQPAEASSNLARYDGIRYGLSERRHQGLTNIYMRSRDAGFGSEVKRRIMIGTFVLSSGYSDAYYHQAVRVRAMLREEFDRVFDQVDVLLTPTSPTVAFPLGARTADPLTMYLADLLTVPANLANIPAMSLPGGFAHQLPVGIQLMAREWNESAIFRVGAAYQLATDWHTKAPTAYPW